jgi:hypothetical protein
MNKKITVFAIAIVLITSLSLVKFAMAGALEDFLSGKTGCKGYDGNMPGCGYSTHTDNQIYDPKAGIYVDKSKASPDALAFNGLAQQPQQAKPTVSATENKDNALSASNSESNSASSATATNTNNINIINQIPQQQPPSLKILSPTINFNANKVPTIVKSHTHTPTPDHDLRSITGYADGYADATKDYRSDKSFDNDATNNGAKHTQIYSDNYAKGYNQGWFEQTH